jgi:8-amino-7-oxononanoate synthase
MANFDSWLKEQKEKGNYRSLQPVHRLGGGRLTLADKGPEQPALLDFSSNDYLALSEHPLLIERSKTFLERYGAGAGASRLMSGDLDIHGRLEQAVASLKNKERGLLFGSGYLANVGVIPALAGRDSLIFTDRLDHASIYDGCLLSRASLVRFRHNDLNHLEDLLKRKKKLKDALIIVESLYSMDGDRCPLQELIELKERFGCLLLVDEAHATGVFGPNGGGLLEELGVSAGVDIAMGTFSKALGSYGAYIAASRPLIELIVNRARSFIFSTALPPAVIGASQAAIELIRLGQEMRTELFRRVVFFKSCLAAAGLQCIGDSQIAPIIIGDSRKALALASALRQKGVYATAVRPPTVPEGSSRLRFSITRHHTEKALQQAAEALLELLDGAGGG